MKMVVVRECIICGKPVEGEENYYQYKGYKRYFHERCQVIESRRNLRCRNTKPEQ